MTPAYLEQDSWGLSNPDTVHLATVQLAGILCGIIQSQVFLHRKVIEDTGRSHLAADIVSSIGWGACCALNAFYFASAAKPAIYINLAVTGGFAAAFAAHAITAKSPTGKKK